MSPFKPVRLPRWAIAVLIVAPSFMGGLAAYSVSHGQDASQANCDAVIGLRNDMVQAFRKIEKRALGNAKTEAEKKLVRTVYEDELIKGIEDPQCP